MGHPWVGVRRTFCRAGLGWTDEGPWTSLRAGSPYTSALTSLRAGLPYTGISSYADGPGLKPLFFFASLRGPEGPLYTVVRAASLRYVEQKSLWPRRQDTERRELPDGSSVAQAYMGSFDCAETSLREVFAPLRMTIHPRRPKRIHVARSQGPQEQVKRDTVWGEFHDGSSVARVCTGSFYFEGTSLREVPTPLRMTGSDAG